MANGIRKTPNHHPDPSSMATILGIDFTTSDIDGLCRLASEKGGLIVVPSGPGLAVDLTRSESYRKAVTEADVAITDSGAMVLFMRLFRAKRIPRISGLRFLQALLREEGLRLSQTDQREQTDQKEGATENNLFWVHPTSEQRKINEAWLEEHGHSVDPSDSYEAPMYSKSDLEDPKLFELLLERKPRMVILCIGGGVQERLGHWLREQYRERGLSCPAIICTGAAIGFMSGNQVNIPVWADRMYLGWLFRCFSEPKKFVPRYVAALPLAYYIARYGEKLPPLRKLKVHGPHEKKTNAQRKSKMSKLS